MKVICTDIKKYLKKERLTVMGLIREMNKLQKIFAPEKKPITRNFYYNIFKGYTPNKHNMYYLSAVLKTHPKKMFSVQFDDTKYKENLATYLSLLD